MPRRSRRATRRPSIVGAFTGLIPAGEMELWVEEKRYLLRTGDSLAFASTRPHRYCSNGAVPLKIVWAIAPPSY